MIEGEYVDWLKKKGSRLFQGAGTSWIVYQGALVPASPYPSYQNMNADEARKLLKESGAWFIRYASAPCSHETSWWHVLCDHYEPESLSAKTRQNVKRGKRECIVREIEAGWLAEHGYQCYAAAFQRYQARTPISQRDFMDEILETRDGPFVYWGVFHEGNLAGYCQCILDADQVITNVTKYNPLYLRHRSAYALIDMLLQTYARDQNKVLSNGSRSIAHNTNYQEVLISLGFRKQFCRLNLIYTPWLRLGIEALYPVRSLFNKLPQKHFMRNVGALLYQEEIRRRTCNAG